jgi:hypothetical protein
MRVFIISRHDHRGKVCNKCKVELKVGDKIVTKTTVKRSGDVRPVSENHTKTQNYHVQCYTDAHGEPIYE